MMSFGQAVSACFRKYVNFEGRAQRSEYWWFWLLWVLAIAVVGLVSETLAGLIVLGMLLPGLAVSVRRLHDVGRSGWWLLIGFIPFVGGLILLYWAVQPGQPGNNAWGANPLGGAAIADAVVPPPAPGQV